MRKKEIMEIKQKIINLKKEMIILQEKLLDECKMCDRNE